MATTNLLTSYDKTYPPQDSAGGAFTISPSHGTIPPQSDEVITITFNPLEVADNLKANGGFIPGIRPGKATSDYLQKVTSRITVVGAIFLAAIATLPTILSTLTGLRLHFGGTSLLIAVGVALETVRALENQMLMRNYQGFLK
jgi:preprotein translocase subunit SecY